MPGDFHLGDIHIIVGNKRVVGDDLKPNGIYFTPKLPVE